MNSKQEQPADIFDLAAALGPNVVRFIPPTREEPQSAGSEWAESLEIIDQAAGFLRSSEERVLHAEARAENIAAKAMEGLKTAHTRVLKAEMQAREAEQRAAAAEQRAVAAEQRAEGEVMAAMQRAVHAEHHAAEEIKAAFQRVAQAEAWAEGADQRALVAESRAEAAEARAKNAEEWLRRVTESLKQKLTMVEVTTAAEPMRRAG
jgi:hypothetical protein